jgi:glycosyltransferase involved in cell wall biosynthesis
MKKNHILLSANNTWSIYNFRKGLIKEFLSNGISVTILAPWDECSVLLGEMGCTVYPLPLKAKGINPISDLIYFIRYVKYVLKLAPDLIINYTIKPNIYGSIAAKIVNVPSLSIITGLGYAFMQNNAFTKFVRVLYSIALKYPLEVWFLNSDDREIFLKYKLINKEKACILDSEGVDVEYYSPQQLIPKNDNVVFLLICRMLWDKGVAEYILAAAEIKKQYENVIFQMLGETGVDNPSAIQYKDVKGWEDEGLIEYLGKTSDVRDYIAMADCVVLPSYREGVPRTMLEAGAMAKPLIATDVPGCREVIVDGETGYLCNVKDSEDLAKKMRLIINATEDERKNIGIASRRYIISRFSERKIVDHYYAFLNKINLKTKY